MPQSLVVRSNVRTYVRGRTQSVSCPRRYYIPNTQILQRKIAVFYQKHFKVHFEKQPASAFRISSVVVGQRTHLSGRSERQIFGGPGWEFGSAVTMVDTALRRVRQSGAFDFTPPRLSRDWFGIVSGLARFTLAEISIGIGAELVRDCLGIFSGTAR